jgi:hypothetical protein
MSVTFGGFPILDIIINFHTHFTFSFIKI